MTIVRSDIKAGTYAWQPTELVNDIRLKAIDHRLMQYLLSKPADWVPRMPDLKRALRAGRDAIYAAIRRLIGLGYVDRKKFRSGAVEYTIRDRSTKPPPKRRPAVQLRLPFGEALRNGAATVRKVAENCLFLDSSKTENPHTYKRETPSTKDRAKTPTGFLRESVIDDARARDRQALGAAPRAPQGEQQQAAPPTRPAPIRQPWDDPRPVMDEPLRRLYAWSGSRI